MPDNTPKALTSEQVREIEQSLIMPWADFVDTYIRPVQEAMREDADLIELQLREKWKPWINV